MRRLLTVAPGATGSELNRPVEAFVAGVLVTPSGGVACSEHGPRAMAVAAITLGTERRYLCRSCADRVRKALCGLDWDGPEEVDP